MPPSPADKDLGASIIASDDSDLRAAKRPKISPRRGRLSPTAATPPTMVGRGTMPPSPAEEDIGAAIIAKDDANLRTAEACSNLEPLSPTTATPPTRDRLETMVPAPADKDLDAASIANDDGDLRAAKRPKISEERKNMAFKNLSSSARRFFLIPELAAEALSWLPIIDLFYARMTCRHFDDIIVTAPKIQQNILTARHWLRREPILVKEDEAPVNLPPTIYFNPALLELIGPPMWEDEGVFMPMISLLWEDDPPINDNSLQALQRLLKALRECPAHWARTRLLSRAVEEQRVEVWGRKFGVEEGSRQECEVLKMGTNATLGELIERMIEMLGWVSEGAGLSQELEVDLSPDRGATIEWSGQALQQCMDCWGFYV